MLIKALKHEHPVIYKIGSDEINVTLIDEKITDFNLFFDPYSQNFIFSASLSHEDLDFEQYITEHETLATLQGDEDLLVFLKNKNEIQGQKQRNDFYRIFEFKCNNPILTGNSFICSHYDSQISITKDAFLELCDNVNNVIDINSGLNKLANAFVLAKEEYLKKSISLSENKEVTRKPKI